MLYRIRSARARGVCACRSGFEPTGLLEKPAHEVRHEQQRAANQHHRIASAAPRCPPSRVPSGTERVDVSAERHPLHPHDRANEREGNDPRQRFVPPPEALVADRPEDRDVGRRRAQYGDADPSECRRAPRRAVLVPNPSGIANQCAPRGDRTRASSRVRRRGTPRRGRAGHRRRRLGRAPSRAGAPSTPPAGARARSARCRRGRHWRGRRCGRATRRR